MRLLPALFVVCATGLAYADAPKFVATKGSFFHRRQISVDPGDTAGLTRTSGRVHDKNVTAWKAGNKVIASVGNGSSFPESLSTPVEAAIDRPNLWSARIVQEGKRSVWVQTGSPRGFEQQEFVGNDALDRAIAHANKHLETGDHTRK